MATCSFVNPDSTNCPNSWISCSILDKCSSFHEWSFDTHTRVRANITVSFTCSPSVPQLSSPSQLSTTTITRDRFCAGLDHSRRSGPTQSKWGVVRRRMGQRVVGAPLMFAQEFPQHGRPQCGAGGCKPTGDQVGSRVARNGR